MLLSVWASAVINDVTPHLAIIVFGGASVANSRATSALACRLHAAVGDSVVNTHVIQPVLQFI
jgi:hypothetical protein